MTTREDYGNAYVCTDCYFAHHYGYRDWTESAHVPRAWTVGPDFGPENVTASEPLARLEGLELADNTCSDHYVGNVVDAGGEDVPLPCVHCGSADEDDGQHEFSWSACEGCGSTLGGSRYRLSLWKIAP